MSVRSRPSTARCIPQVCSAIFALLFAVASSVQAQPTPTQVRLSNVISETIQSPSFEGALWGVHVVNLQSGEDIYAHNADRSVVPASNVKLLTSAAALDRLGPDFRYRTLVYADGPVQDGVLEGNLIIRGSGDPTLGGYRQRDDITRVFRQWADSLREQGIQHIRGDIVGDDNLFDDTPWPTGWTWNDLSHDYAAPIGGLVFNGNTIDVEVRGRTPGAPARIRWSPQVSSFVNVLNRTRTVAPTESSDEEYERALGSNTIHVTSRVHPGEVQEEALAIADPTLYFAHVLREVLLQEGISVNGAPVDVDRLSIRPRYDQETVRRVASYQSPPLRQLLRTLNHESKNLYAEQLLRTLAVEAPPDTTDEDLPDGSTALGVEAVRWSLADAGIDTSQVQLVDGSGLSRRNLVRPRTLTRLLRHMRQEVPPAAGSAFYQSLPIGGEDGTLDYRFDPGAPARGNVRAKTGTLSHVSALSGYVRASDGTPLVFSIVCNHHLADTDAVRAAQDAIVNALAEHSP